MTNRKRPMSLEPHLPAGALFPLREDARFPILKAQAEEHWREFRPKYVQKLQREKKLDEVLNQAVDSAILILHQCERKGLNPDQARELAMLDLLQSEEVNK